MLDFIIIAVILVIIFIFKPEKKIESSEVNISDYCEGNKCKNTCQKINATQMKPGGDFEFGLDSDGNDVPDIKFQADNCDEGTKLIQNFSLCNGGDDSITGDRLGEVECTSDDCCIHKTCGADREYSLEDKLDYLLATNNITQSEMDTIMEASATSAASAEEQLEGLFPQANAALSSDRRRTLDVKTNRDGYCPYQQKAVNPSTECNGADDNHTGGDCGITECCIPKNCANDWVSNENPEWGIGTNCPHQPDSVDSGNMLKYPDDTPCDTCDISECCYEQTNFCIVEANDANSVYNHANTNVGNVGFPSGTNLSFPGNDNTSVDLTTNYFLRKTDVSQTNIQNLLSFGIEDGSDTEDSRYGIKCEDGFNYGMCNAIDDSTDDNTCKIHDNNQRECEAAGCSFTLGIRPRVDYSECGDEAGHNIIKVGNCIDTCTADHTLTDGDINYFTQTPIAAGNPGEGSYRVNPLYDNTGKNSGQEFESGTNVRKYCNNYFGTGEARTYSYTCGGGGSYFTVDELENCNSTCGELRSQGQNCAENKIYNPETNPDTNSLPSNFADFNENCCIPKTCNNGSSGTEIGCRNYEKIIETESPIDSSGSELPINSNNCCERLTCSDYLNEFNRVSVGGGHEGITSENICNSGTFRPENPVSFAYLNSFTSGGSDTEKYNIFKSYQTGVPIEGDTPVVDIGCCQQLTCQEWANHPGNIPGNIPGESEQASANRYCNNNGDGINVFNMSGTFNGNSLDEAVEPGNNSCCISSENITCSPSDELMNPASLVGYNGSPLPENPGPIEFEYDRDSSTFSTVVGDNPYDGVTCTGDGTPSLQCTRDANGENHRYTLTGCNVEPNENVCDEGQSLANGSPKFCVLPNLQDDDHGVVLRNFITGVSDNAIVNVRNFAHQLDNIQCENSTSHPCMRECTNDVLTTSYSGVQTERNQAGEGTYSEADYDSSTQLHIEGCDYQNDFTGNFFTDRFYNGDNGYQECNTLYETRQILGELPDDFDADKINVKHFKCHCEGTQEDTNQPNYGGQLAESCDPSERHIRFKYVFDESVDYLTNDKRHITNTEALDSIDYVKTDIIDGDSICEPGYYPYRGDKEDYCKPCTDLYKNNHPISGISERFCNSGHLFDSSNNISLLPRPDIGNPEYNSNIGHPDISTLRAVRRFAGSATETNVVYSPYFGEDLSPIISGSSNINDINFMTADNFTLGTRVCDSEPDSGTACSPKVKIYGDYSQPATEGSQFDKAKKWWRTYFNNNFNIDEANTDNSDILDISSAPSATTIPDNKPTLKSRIGVTDTGVIEFGTDEAERRFVGGNLDVYFLNIRDRGTENYSYPYDINDITDLKKEHYLYRNNLEIHTPADTTPIPISTVCNNNTSDVDYIPSFNSVNINEGECKACVNEMPSNANTLRQNGDAPFNSPGEYIVKNIDNNINTPICSYEANMYNESYNEGNIVGFKSKTTGEIHHEAEASVAPSVDELSEWNRGPCNEGFIYYRDGYNLATSLISDRQELAPYVKCFPQTKLITKFCENITDEVICNKSFSTGLSDYENDRLSEQLKGILDEGKQQMINNAHTNGFCGWVTNVDADGTRVGECKNIYDTDSNGGYLIHKSPGSLPQGGGAEDYSNHKSLYNQQSVLDYLSPHITSYTTSRDYDYSNLYGNSAVIDWQNTQQEAVTPYQEHETHEVNTGNIKGANDAVFNISNYGVGKDGVSASGSDDLISLSIANALKEGYDPIRPSLHYSNILTHPSGWIPLDDLNRQPLGPKRINPVNTKLNDTMINRCHPILWDGPVDFFYENNSGADGPKTTISSSCYLRDGSTARYLSSSTDSGTGHRIVPDGSGDYSIKSTPLYYNKGRNLQGGTLTNVNYSDDDYAHNILNPGPNLDGIMYAPNYQISQHALQHDSGFSDAAIFPLIDRVRGCFNDSLIYGSQSRPSDSSLGLDADNINNEREQCIFHWGHRIHVGVNSDAAKGCVNACLNNNECDLVRMKKNSSGTQTRCELLKWNKLPDNIRKRSNYFNPGGSPRQSDNSILRENTGATGAHVIKNYHLGGHLINANEEYDQSTRQGVVNWYNRITAPQATEMNHEATIGGDGSYRTEFYSWKSQNTGQNSNIRDWRINHLMGSGGTPGGKIPIKGRPLWKTSTDDSEIWVSMNKIRAPPPDGKIGDILNHINEHELQDIQPIDSGGDEWRFSYTNSRNTAINEENTYYTNDSSTTYPNKYNEKTVKDNSENHLQCPPGTYVQDNNGGYKCSQVINECASCQDIYDYHDKKGDFEGMDDTAKNNLIDSYGGGFCSVSNGTVSGDFLVYINKEKWKREHVHLGVVVNGVSNEGAGGTGLNTTNIMDSTEIITQKTNIPGSFFSNQHNLMAKTPDGNIMDAEKCMCPGTKLVHAWGVGGGVGHGVAVCRNV